MGPSPKNPGPGVYHRRLVAATWPGSPVPQPTELRAAEKVVAGNQRPTPLVLSQSLSDRYDRQVYLKLEFVSPIRSFKHRGALVAVRRLSEESGTHTVVTASTGNHGQGVAFAASLFGLETVVYAPENAAREKLRAMRRLGAEIRIEGENLAQAQQAAAATAGNGISYIEDGESGDLMAGASTVLSEILDSDSDLDTVVVPIGGGNLIAGSLLACELGRSETRIVGVQSTAASAATQSWLGAGMVESECVTFAGGLATTRPGELALAVMIQYLETITLVHEDDLYRAMALALFNTGMAPEGAAAAPIAALERFGDSIPGERIGLLITGNWSSEQEIIKAVEFREAAHGA